MAVLCKHHCRRAVRAALLRDWLRWAELDAGRFSPDSATARFLHDVPAGGTAKLQQGWEMPANSATLKELEGAFEALIDTGRRRRQGAVYTPDFVIDYLLEYALDQLPRRGTPGMLCDPACGSGGFLLRAAWHLHRRHSITLNEAFRRHVVGLDNDAEALDHARCLIELFLALHHEPLSAEAPRLYRRDTLLNRPQELLELASAPRGFDVIATNPPYVKLQNLAPAYRRQLIDRYGPFIKGSYSLAPLFLLAGRRLLADGGCAAFITQNNLFTSLSGQPMRRFLQRQRCLRRIVDFGHERVFSNASAYTCLLFIGTVAQDDFQYVRLKRPPCEQSLAAATFSRIAVKRLCEQKWRLAEQKHLNNLQRIETIGIPLGKLADIRVGFATLKDRVFLLRCENGRCTAFGPDGQPMEVEMELTRGAVKVADLRDEADLGGETLRVIFPYRRVGPRFQIIAEDELRKRFPRGYRYLSSFRELLMQRDKGKNRHEAWYAWGRSQSRHAPGPKLLTKTFDRRANFMLDRSDRLFCNGYSVAISPSKGPQDAPCIELLQRILNSPVMHYYARLTSFQIEGGYQCYQKNFIERFGVPTLTRGQTHKLAAATPRQAAALLTSIYRLSPDDVDEIVGAE